MSTFSSLHLFHAGSELKIVGRVFRLNFSHQHLTKMVLYEDTGKDTGENCLMTGFSSPLSLEQLKL